MDGEEKATAPNQLHRFPIFADKRSKMRSTRRVGPFGLRGWRILNAATCPSRKRKRDPDLTRTPTIAHECDRRVRFNVVADEQTTRRRRPSADAFSSRARVTVVQTTEARRRDDRPAAVLEFPMLRRIPIQRHVVPRRVVVRDALARHAALVCFTERDHVIETLTTNAADHALEERTLPRRLLALTIFLMPIASRCRYTISR